MKVRLFRETFCCFLAALLIAPGTTATAKDQSPDQIKANLSKIGSGEKARAIVKLKSGSVLKGYVSERGDQGFTLVTGKKETKQISYSDVAKVKKNDGNVWIGIGIAVGTIVAVCIGVMYATCGSGGCS